MKKKEENIFEKLRKIEVLLNQDHETKKIKQKRIILKWNTKINRMVNQIEALEEIKILLYKLKI